MALRRYGRAPFWACPFLRLPHFSAIGKNPPHHKGKLTNLVNKKTFPVVGTTEKKQPIKKFFAEMWWVSRNMRHNFQHFPPYFRKFKIKFFKQMAFSTTSNIQLTQEQKERIKANREEALKKRAAAEEKLKLQQQPSKPVEKEEQQNSNEIIKNKNLISVDFKFYLLSSERFKLEFHPFDSSIPLKLKEIPSRNYDSANKIWNFLLKDYEVVKNKLNQLRSKNVLAKFDEIPLGVRKLFLDKISPRNLEPSSSESSSSCLDKADPKIVETLFPFQRSGVSFGIRRGGRLLIADEMGLGKTVQALAIASAFRGEWPLLIICPSSVKYMWYRQIKRFLPSARPCLVEKAKDDLPRSRCTNLVIVGIFKDFSVGIKGV
ncbi:unnamed protein product [Meloidogyne enterolobii]|uniref:Uncharacterized protein n=1 Tax=Meloidogyne enterolobii TaxID=390850 RepID=A0ACB1ASX8_MELEN